MATQADPEAERTDLCPLCRQSNGCSGAADRDHVACWCMSVVIPQEIFEGVPQDLLNKSCICKACLHTFKGSVR